MNALAEAARELEDLKRRVADLETIVHARPVKSDEPPRTSYTVKEVALMVGKKPSTVRTWIAEGRLEAEDMGGWYAVPRDAVDQLLVRRSA